MVFKNGFALSRETFPLRMFDSTCAFKVCPACYSPLERWHSYKPQNHEIVLESKSMNLGDRSAFIYAVRGPISFENV